MLEEKLKRFAIDTHASVNHKYGNYPYSYHLEMVVNEAKSMIELIHPQDREDVICALWLHDSIEDCRLTYNDVKRVSNNRIAEIVYALSNEKGKSRAERANSKYYKGIRKTKYARFAKICDRIANVKHSKQKKSRMFEVYKNESSHFRNSLFIDKGFIYFIRRIFFGKEVINPYEQEAMNKLDSLFN